MFKTHSFQLDAPWGELPIRREPEGNFLPGCWMFGCSNPSASVWKCEKQGVVAWRGAPSPSTGAVRRKADGTASSHGFERPTSWRLNVLHTHCASPRVWLFFFTYGDGLACLPACWFVSPCSNFWWAFQPSFWKR